MRRPLRVLGLAVLVVLGAACGGDAGEGEGGPPGSGPGAASGSGPGAVSAPAVPAPASSGFDTRGAGTSADGSVSVTGAFALDPLGNEQLAFYGVLHAHAVAGDTLVAVSSPWAASGSLHTMAEENGMMRMRPVQGIALPPQSTVRLEPGALHGMLEGLLARPAAGEDIEITFEFANAGQIVLRVPVLHPADAPAAADAHPHP